MGQNQIESISEDAFDTLVRLEVLHLDANKLASMVSLATAVLRPISATLTTLNVGRNAIQSLETDVFLPLVNLKQLNLTGCSIVNITNNAFRGLGGLIYDPQSGLKNLSLSFNALDKFPVTALKQLHNLNKLEIGGNFIENLNEGDLAGLPHLRELDLSDSPNLVHLGSNLLAKNPALNVISVSACHQVWIEADAFTLPSIEGEERQLRLRLSDLEWNEVPEDIVDWSQVSTIDLTSNPLDCDCKLLWLKDVLSAIEHHRQSDANSSSNDFSHVFCQHPYSLQGRPLQVMIC